MKIKYILILLAAAVILSEVWLRLKSPDMLNVNEIIKLSNDQTLGYELMPGAKIKFHGIIYKIPETTIEISDQGFRDRVFGLKKPNVKRIAFIGDSFVFGQGVELEDSIPKQLENLLNENSSAKYEVMNCGVIGYNLEQEIGLMKKKVRRFNPDMIIFLISGNDIYRKIKIPYNKLSNIFFTYSYLYRRSYLKINEYREKKDAEGKNLGTRIRDAVESFKSLRPALTQGQDMVLVIKNFNQWMQVILDICKQEGYHTLDFSPDYRKYEDSITIASYDRHFNPAGTRMIAGKICALLKKEILKNDE